MSRVYADEISGDVTETEQFVVDLESDSFKSDEYTQINSTVTDNANRFPDLRTDGHLVFRRVRFRNQEEGVTEEGLWKLWIPSELVPNLIRQAHDHPLSAHCGYNKTIDKLRRMYYWPKMANDVKKYIAKFDVQRDKSSKHRLKTTYGCKVCDRKALSTTVR